MRDDPNSKRRPAGPWAFLNLLPGPFFAVILVSGIALSFFNPGLLSMPDTTDVLGGGWAARYQAVYERGIAVRGAAGSAWTAVRFAVFGEGEPGVLVGNEGWLYSTEEFVTDGRAAHWMAAAVERIADVHAALAGRDIDLVVALVPTKAEVCPEHLGRYSLPRSLRDRYQAARQGMISRGVPAPDLLSALRDAGASGQVFLRTDTHWSAYGAAAAANAIAAVARPLLDAHGSAREEYVRVRGETEARRGDLLGFIPAGPLAGALGLRPDTVERVVILKSSEDDEGLFDTLEIPVALVGTSYSAKGVWNFDGALKTALSADVLSVAEEGHGPFVPMKKYLASTAIEDPKPDVVVWEIPERYLGVDVPLGVRSIEP